MTSTLPPIIIRGTPRIRGVPIEERPNAASYWRIKRGLTTTWLSEQMGIKSSAISRYETQDEGLSKKNRKRLAELLGIPEWQMKVPGKEAIVLFGPVSN